MTNERENNWHLSKSVPLSLVILIVMQFAALVGLYYKIDNRIANVEKWQNSTQENEYTSKDGSLLEYRVESLERTLKGDLSIIRVDMAETKSDIQVIKTILKYTGIEDNTLLTN